MKYEKVDVGSLVTLRQGFAINKKTSHHMSEVPTLLHLLRIGDMKEGTFSVFVKDTIPTKFIAKEEDIIYTRTGQVGLVFRRQHGVIHNNCFTVTTNDPEVLRQQFLYYVLQEKSFYEEANSRATGAAQPDLPHGAFNSIQITIPPVEKQDIITNILDAYEAFIENNQKQIKLLEEAVQRMYIEWFVDLRFPGYEDTPVEDGIPDGWKKCSILDNDIFIFAKSKVAPFEGQKVYYATADVTGTQISGDGEWITFQNKPSRAAIQPLNESVWFARMSNSYKILNCFGDSSYLSETAIISSGFAGFTACKDCYGFVYATIASKGFDEEKNRYATGATQVSLTNDGLKKIQVVLPTIDVAERYSRIVEPYIEKAEQLKRSIKLLIQARDRLLPKLMSGEIEV